MPAATSPASVAGPTATTAGGGWRLDGQKTWASRGAFAGWCFGLFRSDPSAERHRGLTYFLVPLDSPGVTVRPIPQLDGETGFAELFFEDVFVPDAQVLGGVGEGWRVAMATAGSERGLSLRSPARYTEAAARLVDLYAERAAVDARSAALSADAVAQAWIDAEAYRLNTLWTVARVREGGTVGAEASANKIHWSETDLAIHRTALELAGRRGRDVERQWGDVAGRLPLRPGRTHLCRDQRDPAQRGGRAHCSAYPAADGPAPCRSPLRRQQLEFRDAVRAVLAKECSPADVRAAYESPSWRTPRWSTLAELGVVGMTVPEDHGGLGLGMVDMVVIMEEAGRVALPEPLAATAAVCAPLLVDLGESDAGDDRWTTWLEGIATGQVSAGVGLGPEAEPIAAADGATVCVLGRPAAGPEAAIFLVAADESSASSECTVEPVTSLDPTRRLARVVPAVGVQPVATGPLAADLAGRTARRAAVATAAELRRPVRSPHHHGSRVRPHP